MTTPLSASPPPSPWCTYPLRDAGEVEVALGPLTLSLRERAGEIWASYGREGEPHPPPGGGPLWTRWATAGWDGQVALSPVFPDRAVVVEPDNAFWLTQGAEVGVYVRVPLWVHVEALGAGRTTLLRIPTVVSSDTWWGSLEEGELCYWLSTTARRAFDDTLFQPHLAMCPVRLVNRAADSLLVERVALRVAYLSLYEQDGRIWADETRVRYQGEAEGSQLDAAGQPPAQAPEARLLVGIGTSRTGPDRHGSARLRAVGARPDATVHRISWLRRPVLQEKLLRIPDKR